MDEKAVGSGTTVWYWTPILSMLVRFDWLLRSGQANEMRAAKGVQNGPPPQIC
jgi:hypothetical protein